MCETAFGTLFVGSSIYVALPVVCQVLFVVNGTDNVFMVRTCRSY